MNILILCASHFIADFDLLVLLAKLLFRNNTFMLDASQINFQAAEGFRAKDMIPDQFAIQKTCSSREKSKQATSKDVTAESAPAPSRKRPIEDVGDEKRIKNKAALLLSPDGCSSVEKVDKTEKDALRNGRQDASKSPWWEKCADLTEYEIDVCLLVDPSLKPCIPLKTKYQFIGQQLPVYHP
ncbi:hypothetical protein EDC96DRAFT_588179 [Choanephora cucurbitarum]|nr:hypothetical protein EDC96DRAFT_588179 [Choanephora cucurbitarum]